MCSLQTFIENIYFVLETSSETVWNKTSISVIFVTSKLPWLSIFNINKCGNQLRYQPLMSTNVVENTCSHMYETQQKDMCLKKKKRNDKDINKLSSLLPFSLKCLNMEME